MTRLFVVNVLLGIPGILYFWMLYQYLTQGSGLSAASDLFSSNMVVGPPLAIGAIVWIFVNVALVTRRMRSGSCQNASGKTAHWVTALISAMLPALLMLGLASIFS